jgi:hypothetical protein
MNDLKTTILGGLGAIWIVSEPIISSGSFDFNKDWKSLVSAGIVALLGYFAKDKTKDVQSLVGGRPNDRG